MGVMVLKEDDNATRHFTAKQSSVLLSIGSFLAVLVRCAALRGSAVCAF